MDRRVRWSRILDIAGLVATVLGCIDPLEGSLIILPGTALVALSAFLARSRRSNLAILAFGLTAVGVGTLFGISAVGGFGGATGRPIWWALTLAPYPAGVVLAIVAGALVLAELSRRPKPGTP